jgi:hypothetical protein
MLGRAATAAAIGLVGLTLVACGGEESEPERATAAPPPRRAAPPPPPPSPLVQVDLDVRVQWPEEREPSSVELAEAIATLANGLARGDGRAVRSVLGPDARAIMDRLEEAGAWERGAGSIELVRVCVLSEPADGECELGLGIQDGDGAYLLAWRGVAGGGGWRFEALPLVDVFAGNARQLDGTPLVGGG